MFVRFFQGEIISLNHEDALVADQIELIGAAEPIEYRVTKYSHDMNRIKEFLEAISIDQ
jgi:hypothetical protein